jgi:hypothetical protein
MTPKEAVHSLIDSALAAGQAIGELCAKPDGQLLHFTDAAGLMGIIGSKKLWATRASCMNDASELTYGRSIGRSIVEDRLRANPVSRLVATWKTALAHFDAVPDIPSGLRVYFDAFVTSFCVHADKSVHWLHYGRGGHGYALGFDSATFEVKGWSLVPVIYDRSSQERILAGVFDKIQETAVTLADTFKPNQAVAEKIESTAGHLLVDLTALLAPCFKDRSFDAEEEWRLFWPRLEGEHVGTEDLLPLKFRTRGTLIALHRVRRPARSIQEDHHGLSGSRAPRSPISPAAASRRWH